MKTSIRHSGAAAIALALATTFTATLTGCSDEQEPTAEQVEQVKREAIAVGEAPETNELDKEDFAVIANTCEFGVDFLRAVNAAEKGKGKNVVISPISAQILLSMLANITDATASREIASAIGCEDVDALNRLSYKFINNDFTDSEYADLKIVNAVWYNHNYTLRTNFDTLLERFYNTSAKGRDFSTPSVVIDEINRWCSDNTEGLIDNIVSQLPEQSAAVLANAMYFNAAWERQFDESKTTKGTFQTPTGPKEVDMMHNDRVVKDYISNERFQAICLDLAMRFEAWLILPAEGVEIDDLVDEIKMSDLRDYVRGDIDFAMPRFTYATETIELNKPLEQMGMKSVLSPMELGIFNEAYAGALEIGQKCTVTFNEHGVEASSSTHVGIAMGPPPPTVKATMHLDRPFMFIVSHHEGMEREVPLIAGKIVDP